MPMTITATDELPSQIAVKGVLIGTLITTNTTPGTIISVSVPTNNIYKVVAVIKGRRTDVASGSWFRYNTAAFYNNAGTLAQVGSTTSLSTDGSGGAAAYVISGTDALLQITGPASQTWSWDAYLMYF